MDDHVSRLPPTPPRGPVPPLRPGDEAPDGQPPPPPRGAGRGAVPPPPTPPPGSPRSLGWHPDPSVPGGWRWWDGKRWRTSPHHPRPASRLPAWLSAPVVLAAILVLPGLVFSLVSSPLATLLPLPTFVVVLAVFVWFDRLEPEPWEQRVHAVLWGATVAILASGLVNGFSWLVFGETFALVVSAPVIEEVMKGLGLLYVVRRGKVDSVTDGVVYAGWIAAGFAVVENVEYFVQAAAFGELGAVFVIRGLLSPFAHPLFTLWTGVAIGRAVVRGRDPVAGAIPGLLVAIVLHALWNGSAVAAQGDALLVTLVIIGAFVVLFGITAGLLIRERLLGRHVVAGMVPQIARRYGLTEQEVAVFSDWRRTLAVRRQLPRDQRAAFDANHAAVSRLVALHQRPQPPDPATEARMVARLHRARGGD